MQKNKVKFIAATLSCTLICGMLSSTTADAASMIGYKAGNSASTSNSKNTTSGIGSMVTGGVSYKKLVLNSEIQHMIALGIDVETAANLNYVAGSYTTIYRSDQVSKEDGRTINVELSAKRCNGAIVTLDDTFDYDDYTYKRTKQNGYYMAETFSSGRVTKGYGGGICQTSTMIYNALITSGLLFRSTNYGVIWDKTMINKSEHSLRVPYLTVDEDGIVKRIQPGMDAAVAWGSKIFQVKNDIMEFGILFETEKYNDEYNLYTCKILVNEDEYKTFWNSLGIESYSFRSTGGTQGELYVDCVMKDKTEKSILVDKYRYGTANRTEIKNADLEAQIINATNFPDEFEMPSMKSYKNVVQETIAETIEETTAETTTEETTDPGFTEWSNIPVPDTTETTTETTTPAETTPAETTPAETTPVETTTPAETTTPPETITPAETTTPETAPETTTP